MHGERKSGRLDPPGLPGNGASVANRISTLRPDAPPERTGARRPGRVGRRNIARLGKSARLIRTFAGAIFHFSMRRQTPTMSRNEQRVNDAELKPLAHRAARYRLDPF